MDPEVTSKAAMMDKGQNHERAKWLGWGLYDWPEGVPLPAQHKAVKRASASPMILLRSAS